MTNEQKKQLEEGLIKIIFYELEMFFRKHVPESKNVYELIKCLMALNSPNIIIEKETQGESNQIKKQKKSSR